MKKIVLAAALLGNLYSSIFAQTTNHIEVLCGNDLLFREMETKYPGYRNAVIAAQEAAKQRGQVQRGTNMAPLTVGVAVHVVWKDAPENLADTIIDNQIDILNADFRRFNADRINTRSMFDTVAVDTEINFQLVAVNRVQTNKTFAPSLTGGLPDADIKKAVNGGSDAAPNLLNIWVVKLQPITFGGIVLGQVLGYAYPPADLPNWPTGQAAPEAAYDGVVIDYRAFGSNNPNVIANPSGGGNLVVKGRTPTHEVGHYLGLRHIWGDGGTFGSANDCMQSDGADDTPFANAQSSFDCNLTKNTCTAVEAHYGQDMPDMVENYMDYSAETCMNMFSNGQAQIMRGVLEGPRSNIVLSVNTQNAAFASSIKVFPNPTQNEVTVSLENPNSNPHTLILRNALGQIMATHTTSASVIQHSFEMRKVSAGVYYLEIATKGKSVTKKVIFIP